MVVKTDYYQNEENAWNFFFCCADAGKGCTIPYHDVDVLECWAITYEN